MQNLIIENATSGRNVTNRVHVEKENCLKFTSYVNRIHEGRESILEAELQCLVDMVIWIYFIKTCVLKYMEN